MNQFFQYPYLKRWKYFSTSPFRNSRGMFLGVIRLTSEEKKIERERERNFVKCPHSENKLQSVDQFSPFYCGFKWICKERKNRKYSFYSIPFYLSYSFYIFPNLRLRKFTLNQHFFIFHFREGFAFSTAFIILLFVQQLNIPFYSIKIKFNKNLSGFKSSLSEFEKS